MMENLKLLELPELMDMLAEQTSHYIVMVRTGVSHDEFENCRESIEEIQAEIKLRKGTSFDEIK